LVTAAAAMRMTAPDQLELGIIDAVIEEPGDGAHTDHAATARRIKTAIVETLSKLSQLDEESLLVARYDRLRAIGVYAERDVEPQHRDDEASLRRRVGRFLRLPGFPRRPRWSDIWPSGDEMVEQEDVRDR
jgi:hypothetical protein